MYINRSKSNLADDDLRFVEKILIENQGPSSVTSISELDGYMTAVISGPRTLSPILWISQIWGESGEGPCWDDTADAERFFSIVMRLNNEICDSMLSESSDFEAIGIIENRDGEEVRVMNSWCSGYMKGVKLSVKDWVNNEIEFNDLMLPIMVLAGEFDDSEESFSDEEMLYIGDIIEELAQGVYLFWIARRQDFLESLSARNQRGFGFDPQPVSRPKRDGVKVGANDPCICGSGRKYKKCCGN